MNQKLDQITAKEAPKSKEPSVEEILKEFEGVAPTEGTPRGGDKSSTLTKQDIDSLSNTELVELMMENINANVVNPIVERLEYIRVQGEVREARRNHADFDEVKEDVFKIAMRNPNLSIEDAYDQAIGKKVKNAKPEKPEDKDKDKDKDKTQTPPVTPPQKRVPSAGAKPQISASTVQKGDAQTIKEAATRAAEEVLAGSE